MATTFAGAGASSPGSGSNTTSGAQPLTRIHVARFTHELFNGEYVVAQPETPACRDYPCFRRSRPYKDLPLFLYYRPDEARWVLSDQVTPNGTVFCHTEMGRSRLCEGWRGSRPIEATNALSITRRNDPRGHNHEALWVSGFRDALVDLGHNVSGDELYDGIYLRRGPSDPTEQRSEHPHYVQPAADSTAADPDSTSGHLYYRFGKSCVNLLGWSFCKHGDDDDFVLGREQRGQWVLLPPSKAETRVRITVPGVNVRDRAQYLDDALAETWPDVFGLPPK